MAAKESISVDASVLQQSDHVELKRSAAAEVACLSQAVAPDIPSWQSAKATGGFAQGVRVI
eukprot:355166-Chlamydomonas_euryale.AAC.3